MNEFYGFTLTYILAVAVAVLVACAVTFTVISPAVPRAADLEAAAAQTETVAEPALPLWSLPLGVLVAFVLWRFDKYEQ